jgi:hypothetical protein
MPWYYAGPEAKPVGPVSLEELHARRLSGAILPETYVIEDTGQPDPARAWKRYRDLFPANPYLPPIPTAAPVAAIAPPPPPPVAPAVAPATGAHPLFPSAAAPGHHPVFTAPAGPDPYYSGHKANSWCAWALGLGISSFFLIPFCGLGTMMALVSIFMGVGGLVQVQGHRGQSGRGFAIVGILASLFTLVVTVILLVWVAMPVIKAHEQTTTEQTSNDSE